jgi:hypothetical protein
MSDPIFALVVLTLMLAAIASFFAALGLFDD